MATIFLVDSERAISGKSIFTLFFFILKNYTYLQLIL